MHLGKISLVGRLVERCEYLSECVCLLGVEDEEVDCMVLAEVEVCLGSKRMLQSLRFVLHVYLCEYFKIFGNN